MYGAWFQSWRPEPSDFPSVDVSFGSLAFFCSPPSLPAPLTSSFAAFFVSSAFAGVYSAPAPSTGFGSLPNPFPPFGFSESGFAAISFAVSPPFLTSAGGVVSDGP